jgi:hypothetical protein
MTITLTQLIKLKNTRQNNLPPTATTDLGIGLMER